jgi:hypothetical protein
MREKVSRLRDCFFIARSLALRMRGTVFLRSSHLRAQISMLATPHRVDVIRA